MKVSNYALFHIMLILKRWYVDEKQIEQESQTQLHPFIIGLNDSINSETSIHTEQYFPDSSFHLLAISFNETHSKVNYRKAYVTINGLLKKAIQAELDAGSSTIQDSSDEDFIAIENPVVHSKRRTPRKKRIKSSHKLESKNSFSAKHSQTQKIRKPTQC
ncbi:10991_t:CDS:2, partial [Gigaspora margarita]